MNYELESVLGSKAFLSSLNRYWGEKDIITFRDNLHFWLESGTLGPQALSQAGPGQVGLRPVWCWSTWVQASVYIKEATGELLVVERQPAVGELAKKKEKSTENGK